MRTGLALACGYAVRLLDSPDQVPDNDSRICGKVWDDDLDPLAVPNYLIHEQQTAAWSGDLP